MITGMTHNDRQARLRAWKPAFAWLPVRLSDGRWVWRDTYFYRDSSDDWNGGPGCYTLSFRQRVLQVPAPWQGPRRPPFAGSVLQLIATAHHIAPQRDNGVLPHGDAPDTQGPSGGTISGACG